MWTGGPGWQSKSCSSWRLRRTSNEERNKRQSLVEKKLYIMLLLKPHPDSFLTRGAAPGSHAVKASAFPPSVAGSILAGRGFAFGIVKSNPRHQIDD